MPEDDDVSVIQLNGYNCTYLKKNCSSAVGFII